jgi:hypothetical protein
MTENTIRQADEIDAMFDRVSKLIDLSIEALLDQYEDVDDLDTLSPIIRKKLEMSLDYDVQLPHSNELICEVPEWWDGYRYGLLRGYWRTLCWIHFTDDIDLLEEKD